MAHTRQLITPLAAAAALTTRLLRNGALAAAPCEASKVRWAPTGKGR